MKAYVANLGQKNVYWPVCRSESALTLETGEQLYDFWRKGDKPGWLDWATKNVRMINGQLAIAPVASRWFNLLSIFHETEGDIWIHRDSEYLYWTVSIPSPVTYELVPDPLKKSQNSILMKRGVEPWRNRAKDGRPLLWKSIHPKAHDFLRTEATYQEIANDRQYRDYAFSLIEGPPLKIMHERIDWRESLGKKTSGRTFSKLEVTIADAIMRIKGTVARADGRTIEVRTKIKELIGSETELERFLVDLYRQTEGMCALTGLKMLLKDEEGPADFRLSVDRIDSSGHYGAGNVQLTCQFANFWKSNRDDKRFKELIQIIRASSSH